MDNVDHDVDAAGAMPADPARAKRPVPNAAAAFLGFMVGPERWLVRLADCAELLPMPPITAVPATVPWFLGVANLRGALYGVTDFAQFQRLHSTAPAQEARIVLPHARYRSQCALRVGRSLGLLSREQFEPDTDNGEVRPWIDGRLRDGAGEIWLRLNWRPLLAASEFLDIAA